MEFFWLVHYWILCFVVLPYGPIWQKKSRPFHVDSRKKSGTFPINSPSCQTDAKSVPLVIRNSNDFLTHNLCQYFHHFQVRYLEIIQSNIIFVTSFYFIYLFLWLRQMKFYQDPLLKDNYPQLWFKIQNLQYSN